jgi:putative copper export protein
VTTWTLIRFLHLVAIAFFVGGQLLLVVAVAPVLRNDEATMRSVAKRFGLGSGVALAVVIATGAAMASHYGLWADDVLHAKLAVLVLVGVLTFVHITSTRTRAISIGLVVSSLVVVWLGVKLTYG